MVVQCMILSPVFPHLLLQLQLEQGSMKLLFAYNGISARVEIEFKDIAEFKVKCASHPCILGGEGG